MNPEQLSEEREDGFNEASKYAELGAVERMEQAGQPASEESLRELKDEVLPILDTKEAVEGFKTAEVVIPNASLTTLTEQVNPREGSWKYQVMRTVNRGAMSPLTGIARFNEHWQPRPFKISEGNDGPWREETLTNLNVQMMLRDLKRAKEDRSQAA